MEHNPSIPVLHMDTLQRRVTLAILSAYCLTSWLEETVDGITR